ncbi:hypothetical protein [Phyllobacterium sp. K27]
MIIPDPEDHLLRPSEMGDDMASTHQRQEALQRWPCRSRTALFGPVIAWFLEDSAIVEVVLNSDIRVDRLRRWTAFNLTDEQPRPDRNDVPAVVAAHQDIVGPATQTNGFISAHLQNELPVR